MRELGWSQSVAKNTFICTILQHKIWLISGVEDCPNGIDEACMPGMVYCDKGKCVFEEDANINCMDRRGQSLPKTTKHSTNNDMIHCIANLFRYFFKVIIARSSLFNGPCIPIFSNFNISFSVTHNSHIFIRTLTKIRVPVFQ